MSNGEFPTRLKRGYANFRAGRFTAERERYDKLASIGQTPSVMIIACCDSRAAPRDRV